MLHTIPEAQTVAMIEEVSSFFDETSESDLLNLFTEIDESDLSLLEVLNIQISTHFTCQYLPESKDGLLFV